MAAHEVNLEVGTHNNPPLVDPHYAPNVPDWSSEVFYAINYNTDKQSNYFYDVIW